MKKVFILHIKRNLKAISDKNLARIMTFCSFCFFFLFLFVCFFFIILQVHVDPKGSSLSLAKSQELF